MNHKVSRLDRSFFLSSEEVNEIVDEAIKMRTYSFHAKQILIAIDQVFNTFLFGGYADETMSSHLYRYGLIGRYLWLRNLVDWVAGLFGDKDHCYQSYLNEVNQEQEPPSVRKARLEGEDVTTSGE